MDRWLGAAAGIGFAVALVLAGVVDDHGADAFLWGIATALFAVFLGVLRSRLRQIEGDTASWSATAVIAGSIAGSMYALMATTYAGYHEVGLELPEGPPGSSLIVFAASFAQAVVAGASGSVLYRLGEVWRLLAVVGTAVAVAQLAGAAMILWMDPARTGQLFALAPFAAWVAATGVVLSRARA